MRSRFSRFLSGFLAVLLTVAVVIPPSPALAQSAQDISPAALGWFDPDWHYRRAITVTNSTSQVLNNQQIVVTLAASNFNFNRSNGKDIRFTDADGMTQLSHWTETYDSGAQTASFVVLVPQVLASSSKTIYVYYGNTAVSDASSGPKTFNFYDGFERLKNAPTPLSTPTYDGSGQTVHPDIVSFENGWNGYKYWMAHTPYPGSNDQRENPSILASNDGTTWVTPSGVSNPLAPAPPCDHNSDADMIYNDDTGELWMYYLDTRRAARCNGHQTQPYYNHNYLKLVKSSDGINWSSPVTVIDWDLDVGPLYVSPSIVKRGSTFYLWAVNSSNFTIRAASGNGMSFGNSQAVTTGGQAAWHVDVEYIPSKNEYWMMFNYPSIPNGTIRFARSADRLNWTTYSNPALSYTSGWDRSLYRSTFLYDVSTNRIRLWYSANNNSSPIVWHVGEASMDYDEFLNGLIPGGGWSREQGSGSWSTATAQAKRGVQSAQLVQSSGTSMAVSKPAPLANNFYLEIDVYDDLDSSAFKMVRAVNGTDQRLGVGVWTGASTGNYVYHNKNYGYTVTSVNRTKGWHKFGILIKANSSMTYFIDGQNVGTMSGQFNNVAQIQAEGYNGGTTSFFVDDIRVRKWVNPEPVAVAGAEELK